MSSQQNEKSGSSSIFELKLCECKETAREAQIRLKLLHRFIDQARDIDLTEAHWQAMTDLVYEGIDLAIRNLNEIVEFVDYESSDLDCRPSLLE